MTVSVILPVYNEEKTIEEIINALQSMGSFAKEIIVIDDGSTDGTASILEQMEDNNVKFVRHKENQGKGAAIRTGIKYASGDVIVVQDADLEYDPKEYPDLIKLIVDGEADVVYGSRFLGQISGMAWPNYIANKILTITTNILYGANITDEATCYKAFRSNVLKNIKLECKKFEFCPEVTARVCKQGIKIKEVPITYKGRTPEEGKKIAWQDGFVAIYTLLKYRFKD